MRTPKFENKVLETEKQIIQAEILNYKGEDGQDIDINELTLSLFWPDTNLSQKILGETERVSKFNEKDLRWYWDKFYRPNNSLFCVVGNFDAELYLTIIKKTFSEPELQRSKLVIKKTFYQTIGKANYCQTLYFGAERKTRKNIPF